MKSGNSRKLIFTNPYRIKGGSTGMCKDLGYFFYYYYDVEINPPGVR